MKFLRLSGPTIFFVLLAGCAWPTSARAASFEELSRTGNAVKIDSAVQLRANAVAMEGRLVDLEGEITGLMTRRETQTVLLRMGEEMAVLTVAPTIENANLLRTGVLVRVLVRVNGENKDGMFLIEAVSDKVSSAARNPKTGNTGNDDAGNDDAEIIAPMAGTVETLPEAPGVFLSQPSPKVTIIKGTKVTPPAKAGTAIKANNAAKIRSNKSAAQLPNDKPSAGQLEDLIASQVPAYSAIVRRHNKKLKPETVQEISEALLRAGYKHNMDPRFIAAIIAVESDFDVFCRSGSGAMGLGQMMPFNLKEAGVKNPWNPTENVMGTAQLLRNLLDSYKNRPDGTLLAVAAYNAGSGAVRRAGYKVPNGSQVQRYVWKVYNRYKAFAPDMFD